jgi:hypothetical protein
VCVYERERESERVVSLPLFLSFTLEDKMLNDKKCPVACIIKVGRS